VGQTGTNWNKRFGSGTTFGQIFSNSPPIPDQFLAFANHLFEKSDHYFPITDQFFQKSDQFFESAVQFLVKVVR